MIVSDILFAPLPPPFFLSFPSTLVLDELGLETIKLTLRKDQNNFNGNNKN
jgi:hypothetical protein